MSNMVPVRDIETVTAEINIITEQTQRGLLTGAIEIGRRLVEAKSMVHHGEWGKYLQERVNYSQSSANNLMKLYQEYGDDQASLFSDFKNSQAFKNLTYTKALAMLALPADMRQSFAEEHDVENKSTREVQAEVQAELEKMKAKAGDLEKKLEDACENNDVLRQRLEDSQATSEELKERAEAYAKDLTKAQEASAAAAEQVDKLKKQLDTARQNRRNAEEALKAARENPQIPEAMMEEMRQQVAAQAAKEATEELEKKLADAENAAQSATMQRKIAEVQIEELEKQLQASSPNMIRLGTYLEAMQEAWEKFIDVLTEIREEDPETADKLKANTKAKVLDPMVEQLNGV